MPGPLFWGCSGAAGVLAWQFLAKRFGKCVSPDGTLRGRPEGAKGYDGDELAKGTYVATDPPDGAFVRLTWGKTFYTLMRGPGSARPLVVCVHGFGGESSVFYSSSRSKIAEELVKVGYDVLSFDLYGHGFSEGPDIMEYNAELFASQMAELLVRLDIEGKFDLVSHSFGGPVATVFAARFPNRIRRLVLMAPAFIPAIPWVAAKVGEFMIRSPVCFHFVVEKLKPMGQGANRDNMAFGRSFHRMALSLCKNYKVCVFNDPRFSPSDLLGSLPKEIQISFISGDADTDADIKGIQALSQQLEAPLDIVHGAGHVTYFDGPQAAEQGPIMREFLLKRLPLP